MLVDGNEIMHTDTWLWMVMLRRRCRKSSSDGWMSWNLAASVLDAASCFISAFRGRRIVVDQLRLHKTKPRDMTWQYHHITSQVSEYSEWVSRFLTANQHSQAIQKHSHWFTPENTGLNTNGHTTKTKHNPENINNAKYSKTKLLRFSRLLWHSARKQLSWAHTGLHITSQPHLIYWSVSPTAAGFILTFQQLFLL